MNELLSFLTMWLVDLLVLGTALLAVTCLALVFLRQPAARMALARGTLLGLAMLCVLTILPCWPRHPLAGVFSRGVAQEEVELFPSPNTAVIYSSLPGVESPAAPAESLPSAASVPQSLSLSKVLKFLPLLWLGAAGLGLAYIFVGAWRAFCLLRNAVKAPAWSQQELERLVSPKSRSPRLKTSERIATAVALLAWRPHILLAARSVTEENKAAVRAAMAHEWAHIRHGDLWLLALERLLLPLFCLHPLFWLLRRQIRLDQELLADAAAAGDAPVEYAQALLNWAKAESTVTAPGFGIAALSLWEHPSSLSRRVEMLLHPKPSAAAGVSRLWRWLAPLSLLAAVLGLSLVTLRPAAIAQDGVVVDVEVQVRPEKIKKAKKVKPRKSEAKRTADSSPLPVAEGEQILMTILVGQVEHAALENAESSLGDLIQAASEDHCRLEGNLIVAELSAEQFARLTGELKKAKALEILSRPRLTTIDGQEATLQVGQQVPLARQDETINGAPQRRVDFQTVGETIVICPHVNDKDPSRLTLDITATHTELDKKAELRTGDDTPRFTSHQFKLGVEASVGKTLVVTEREPKKGSGRVHSIILAIGPQKLAPPVPEPAPPVATRAKDAFFGSPNDLTRLRDENAVLRKQVDDLRAKLVDLEVQIRWLRAAAGPDGEKKVNDEEFLRRVYLDLMGLLPTPEETKAFLTDKDPQKRDKLIDKLLEGNAGQREASGGWIKWKAAVAKDPQAKPTTIKPAPDYKAGEEQPADSLHVFRLSHSNADDVAQMLAKVFPKAEGLAVAVEVRTNSLIIRGTPETLEKVKALLETLDREPDPKLDAKEPSPPEKGDSLRSLKGADLRAAEASLQAAQAQYDRIQILHKEKAVSEAELDQAAVQLKHAEVVLEAAKGDRDSVKLRELELQEAEAALRTAERALLEGESMRAAGKLSSKAVEALSLELRKKSAGARHAMLRLVRTKNVPVETPE